MISILNIEIQQSLDPPGWRVWFGTWTADRWSKVFTNPKEAEALAQQKFNKLKRAGILYPRNWPLTLLSLSPPPPPPSSSPKLKGASE